MKTFSAKTLIDDILLLVRNNNISESEDLSRAQILSWIILYKAYFTKKLDDKDKEDGDDTSVDDSQTSTIGPLELIDVIQENCKCCPKIIKRTKDKVYTLEDSNDDIITVMSANGCLILCMPKFRKHYHRFRQYTFMEPACWLEDQYLYIDCEPADNINNIYITAKLDPTKTAEDEDDIDIPGWMVPDIKKAIMANELSFMLQRPSDDSNNSTLASVKPNGPQDKEE